MNKYIKEIVTFLVLLILYATNPAKSIHTAAIYEELDLFKKNGLNDRLQFYKEISNAQFDVESFILFSKTTCQIGEEYHVIGIGLLGHVYFLVDIKGYFNNKNVNQEENTGKAAEDVSVQWEPAIESTSTQ